MAPFSSLIALVSLPPIWAGHGYDIGRDPTSGSGGDAGGGGIGRVWIVAGIVLTLIAIGIILISLSPSGARTRLKTLGPKMLVLALIAGPLVAWTATSGAGGKKSLIVERWTNDVGGAELVVSLGDRDLNTLETTDGKRVVRLECVGEDGRVLLAASEQWPFVYDRRYPYPHTHRRATREQVQQADSCSLRGTRVPLEADVEGALTR